MKQWKEGYLWHKEGEEIWTEKKKKRKKKKKKKKKKRAIQKKRPFMEH